MQEQYIKICDDAIRFADGLYCPVGCPSPSLLCKKLGSAAIVLDPTPDVVFPPGAFPGILA